MMSHHFPIALLYVSMLSWYCVTFSEKQEGIIRLNAQTQKKVISHASELI